MFVQEPTILHADVDSFFASVEQRDDPKLRGRPVIVGGGVVLAASYEAKAYGVRTAMGGRQARRLCPNAIVVSPRMSAYSEASKAMFEVFEDTTPLVEGLSIDEAFLDVRGLERLAGRAPEIAERLRASVLDRVGLPITVGVARTKFLAKVASAVAKPNGLLVVPPDGELGFLHPLPVERLWGVGRITAEKLHSRGIRTVAQVAALDEAMLVYLLGQASGRHLHALAHLRDPRPVQTGRRRRSIGSQRALGSRPRSMADIDATVVALVDRVTRRLRTGSARVSHGRPSAPFRRLLAGDAVADDAPGDCADAACTGLGTRARRGLHPAHPRAGADAHRDLAAEPRGRRPHAAHVRFDPRLDELDAALDLVRDRFGSAAVTRGVLVDRDPGVVMPVLPD